VWPIWALHLEQKRLGLMHEMVPKVCRLRRARAHPTYPASAPFISDVKAGARSMGLRIEVFNASTESEIDTAFRGAERGAQAGARLLLANQPAVHHPPGADHRARRPLRGTDNVCAAGICQRRPALSPMGRICPMCIA